MTRLHLNLYALYVHIHLSIIQVHGTRISKFDSQDITVIDYKLVCEQMIYCFSTNSTNNCRKIDMYCSENGLCMSTTSQGENGKLTLPVQCE